MPGRQLDRALHELEILRKELEVVHSDISCQSPKLFFDSSIMTDEMACRTNSPDDSETAGKDFRWTMTFRNDGEVVNEEHSVPSDVMFLTENNTVEEQRWIGECTADMPPGDILDLGFNYNSDVWPNESHSDDIQEALKRVSKLKEGLEINKRPGPM